MRCELQRCEHSDKVVCRMILIVLPLFALIPCSVCVGEQVRSKCDRRQLAGTSLGRRHRHSQPPPPPRTHHHHHHHHLHRGRRSLAMSRSADSVSTHSVSLTLSPFSIFSVCLSPSLTCRVLFLRSFASHSYHLF